MGRIDATVFTIDTSVLATPSLLSSIWHSKEKQRRMGFLGGEPALDPCVLIEWEAD